MFIRMPRDERSRMEGETQVKNTGKKHKTNIRRKNEENEETKCKGWMRRKAKYE